MISDFGMRERDDHKSEIPNPQSEIPKGGLYLVKTLETLNLQLKA